MLYDDDFILSLPEELSEAIVRAIAELNQKGNRTAEDTFEARDLVVALMTALGTSFDDQLRTSPDNNNVFNMLQNVFNEHIQRITTQKSASRQETFSALLGRRFHYDLSEADAKRIQNLINELRGFISESEQFGEEHKRRLVDRLESLQRELHRRLSNLDRFYGLIGDAGVLLGKFGNDAKPFVDRIREIVEIIWRAQAGAEQLPASAKPALLSDGTSSAPE